MYPYSTLMLGSKPVHVVAREDTASWILVLDKAVALIFIITCAAWDCYLFFSGIQKNNIVIYFANTCISGSTSSCVGVGRVWKGWELSEEDDTSRTCPYCENAHSTSALVSR